MRSWRALTILGAAILWTACQEQTATEEGATEEAAVDVAAEEQALADLESRYEQAIGAKDVDTLVSLYTDDVLWSGHDGTTLQGEGPIRDSYQPMIEAEGTASADIRPEVTVVAASGDIAHQMGTYTSTITAPDGQAMSETYRYVVVFRKVDGEWKIAGGMDSAPIAPEAAAGGTTAP